RGTGQERPGRSRPGRAGFRRHRSRHRDAPPAARPSQAPPVASAGPPGLDQPDGLQQRRRGRAGRKPPAGAAPDGRSPRGEQRDTPAEEALSDYLHCLRTLYPLADYFVVNVSSPNTPGLRDLQRERSLDRLLSGITAERDRLAAAHGETKPVLVKVAPDMSPGELDAVVDVCLRRGAGGIVATNTTVARPGLRGPEAALPGGLSGAPLFDASTRTVAAIYRRVGGRLPVIGVGGVMSAADAYAKIKAGARLVQVLTGFVY